MADLREVVRAAFMDRYGTQQEAIVRAPGRVNVIGEHTDYNDGFVLPAAIDRAIWIALRPRTDGLVRLHSLDFDLPIHFDLTRLERQPTSPAEYVKGVAYALIEAGHTLHGFDGVMHGDVPIGAGLSSSAALELATARAFALASGIAWAPVPMAKLAQKAENEWVGMQCGIMDQLISAVGVADHAVLIDCRSLEAQPAPLPPGCALVILDTGTRRGLVGEAYNERRAQCEAAAAFFDVPALRDVSEADLKAHSSQMDPLTLRRARHIVTENARTLAAFDAMQAGDAVRLGTLMHQSHLSLRDDFEVSSPALNRIVAIAQEQPGCYGARMTGAGFGGCAVALVAADQAQAFAQAVAAAYDASGGQQASVTVCHPADGAALC